MRNNIFGDTMGGFADAAVLFPLIAALSMRSDFSGAVLLATAGAAYLVAGFLFRIPMAVQPLKAVAIAAIASGAHRNEVRIAGAVLGGVCLLLCLFPTERAAARVPRALVHGLQLALGVILIVQGWKVLGADPLHAFAAGSVAVALVVATRQTGFPVLGLLATGGLLWALFSPPLTGTLVSSGNSPFRWEMVLLLALPQVVLTLANSVIGTIDVSRRYYGSAAEHVTARRLLLSIGFGNVLFSVIGGLPFCHGSGGLTAHYRGGARTWFANGMIGIFLLALAFFGGSAPAALPYPPVLLGILLAATGIFHWQLAAPTWEIPEERWRLTAMALVALITQNMLWVLLSGLVPEMLGCARKMRMA